MGMKIITSSAWVAQGITSKATAGQSYIQALGFHSWKRLCMLNHAESWFEEMHYALVASGICFVYFSESTKSSQPQTKTGKKLTESLSRMWIRTEAMSVPARR